MPRRATTIQGRSVSARPAGDETVFELIPDDHPTETIAGNIIAPAGSSVVKVVLRNVPSSNGAADRVTYFCRFEDDTEA